ncbi:MAG: hypothetical protein ACKVIH_04920 [Burkholderiales bacterium]
MKLYNGLVGTRQAIGPIPVNASRYSACHATKSIVKNHSATRSSTLGFTFIWGLKKALKG